MFEFVISPLVGLGLFALGFRVGIKRKQQAIPTWYTAALQKHEATIKLLNAADVEEKRSIDWQFHTSIDDAPAKFKTLLSQPEVNTMTVSVLINGSIFADWTNYISANWQRNKQPITDGKIHGLNHTGPPHEILAEILAWMDNAFVGKTENWRKYQ